MSGGAGRRESQKSEDRRGGFSVKRRHSKALHRAHDSPSDWPQGSATWIETQAPRQSPPGRQIAAELASRRITRKAGDKLRLGLLASWTVTVRDGSYTW